MSTFTVTKLLAAGILLCIGEGTPQCRAMDEDTIRFATFNCSLNRNQQGGLATELAGGTSEQAWKVARILRTIRPDVVLLNEFDHDAEQVAIEYFQRQYLEAVDSAGTSPISYEYRFVPEVNTGQPSGLDFNRNGQTTDAEDAFGFGRFPGQYGLVVLSRVPIDAARIRTFRKLPWNAMPDAAMPVDEASGESWYDENSTKVFRLSSKNHCDVPVIVGGVAVHLLASHPTPPAFDGVEDRNGRRNHDEIRFWADYLTPDRSGWIVDDHGTKGGLTENAAFVILGDLNADPCDGDSYRNAVGHLLSHSRINVSTVPKSSGAVAAAKHQGQRNERHRGPHAHDTSDFNDNSVGNLRVDYVLPSTSLTVRGSGVFWPVPGESGSDWIDCSDHRLVWVNVLRP